MNRIGIAQFEKVSFNQWKTDMLSGDFKEEDGGAKDDDWSDIV
jgi:hypothetical protein